MKVLKTLPSRFSSRPKKLGCSILSMIDKVIFSKSDPYSLPKIAAISQKLKDEVTCRMADISMHRTV